MESILKLKSRADMLEYFVRCQDFCDLNVYEAQGLAEAAIKYYKGSNIKRAELRQFQALEAAWYESLERGAPDYSIYNDLSELADLWACWVLYSRKYLLEISNPRSMGNRSIVEDCYWDVGSVIDLGCGFGYTTAGLKELFPDAEVWGTNFPKSYQYQICKSVGEQRGFQMLPFPCVQADLVFASEYFEHIQDPVRHLNTVLEVCRPKVLIIANSFGARSVGHFPEYLHDDELVSNKKIGRIFNNYLRFRGYEKQETNLWNNRPSYWKIKS